MNATSVSRMAPRPRVPSLSGRTHSRTGISTRYDAYSKRATHTNASLFFPPHTPPQQPQPTDSPILPLFPARPSVAVFAKKYHTVQKGEWLSSIAPQYNVTTEKLKEANVKTVGEAGDLIYPGQQLVIPAAQGAGIKGFLFKLVLALVVVAAGAGIWPSIKKSF